MCSARHRSVRAVGAGPDQSTGFPCPRQYMYPRHASRMLPLIIVAQDPPPVPLYVHVVHGESGVLRLKTLGTLVPDMTERIL